MRREISCDTEAAHSRAPRTLRRVRADMDIRPPGSGSQPIKRTVGFSIAGGEEEVDEQGGLFAFSDELRGEHDGLGELVGSPSPVLITPHYDGPRAASINSEGEGSIDDDRSVRARHPHGTYPVSR